MKVLAAISDQEIGEKVLKHLQQRKWGKGVEVHFVNVVTWLPNRKERESWPGLNDFAAAKQQEAEELVKSIADRFETSSPSSKAFCSVLHGHAGEQLLTYVQEHKIDETMVAPHHRTELSKFLFGNVSAELFQHLPGALTIIKN